MRKSTLPEMRRLAKRRGGTCISRRYVNSRTPLSWKCRLGHEWTAMPTNVVKVSWCRGCYNLRRRFHGRHSLHAMRDLAISRGGVCLSAEYLGSKVKLRWECTLGHRWQAAPSYVIQGTWCPVCARSQRLGLPLFQELAANRGGMCLSGTYVNERTALHWRCADGHEWKASPEKIKRGSWCPACANIRRRSKWMPQRAVRQREFYKAAMPAKARRIQSRDCRVRANANAQSADA